MIGSGSAKRKAFSVLEVLVVVALISVVMGVVILRLSGPHHQAIAQHAAGKWILMDQQMRHRSQQLRRPGSLTFEMDGRLLSRTSDSQGDSQTSVVELPAGVSVDKHHSASRLHDDDQRDHRVIRYSSLGQTDTYAVRLAGPGKIHTWLLFLGITGEVKRGCTEEEVFDILHLSWNKRS